MPMVLWTILLMEAQGYEMKDNIVYQDNKTTMLLTNNRKSSIGKRKNHINVKYFFVTDRLARKDISMEYCPTSDMYGNFYTMPTQGGLYKTQRQAIINIQYKDPNEYGQEG